MVRRALQLIAVCAVAAGLALPVAAGTSPSQLLARSLAAAKAAKTVHVVATGIPSGGSSIGFDLRIVAGRGGGGTLTLGKQRIQILRIGNFAYFQAGASFWQQTAGKPAAQLFAGRWVKMPSSTNGFSSFTELTNISSFFSGLLGSHGKLGLSGTKTVNGVKAIGIVDRSSSGGTLWVAARGVPFPVALTPPSGPGAVAFDAWNAPMTLSTPRNAIDFSKLKK